MTPDRSLASPAIRLSGVRVRYDKTELAFDCAVKKGEIVAVTGVSGAGKSTLFNVIAGFETPDAGRIEIEGRDVAASHPAERPVSVIFQDHNLFAHLTVAANVGLGIDPGLRLGTGDKTRIAASLLRVGLEGFGKRLPPTLSGGERQRVALARALVQRKPILLLDEPFAALDSGLRAGMSQLLADLHRDEKNTVLIITHQPEDVRRLADSVLFLHQGRVMLHEPTAQFLDRKHDPAIVQFLGE